MARLQQMKLHWLTVLASLAWTNLQQESARYLQCGGEFESHKQPSYQTKSDDEMNNQAKDSLEPLSAAAVSTMPPPHEMTQPFDDC